MPIALPQETSDFDDIKNNIIGDNTACIHPAGHCYGSDGGSGIAENLKVPKDQGGNKEVYTLDSKKETIINKAVYLKCQYCGRFLYAGESKAEENKSLEENN